MMQALVVNCSKPCYNLGACKLADWLRDRGNSVDYWDGDPGLFSTGYDLVALSVIFSWHAPRAREIALRLKDHSDIWCGGPGMFAMGNWWARETGLRAHKGIDQRFERQRGRYKMTFASRGCPVNCSFCIVPKIEGLEFALDPDFVPAPVLCDNNLSALPVEFQEHIIRRYRETGITLKDANSGFEPRTFDEGTYERWRAILKGPFRFALDEMRELEDVRRMMAILRELPAKRKRVYVLCGNEPVATCYERAQKVIEWGGEPFAQYVRPLNWLGGDQRHRYDWTEQRGRDFCRYYNRFIWRYAPIWEYADRKGEPPPLQFLAARTAETEKAAHCPKTVSGEAEEERGMHHGRPEASG